MEEQNLKKNELTINQLFQKVWKHLWSTKRYVESGHAKIVTLNFNKHIAPVFGEYAANKLTRRDIREWHSLLSGTPITANRSLSVLSRMYSFAIEMEWTEENPTLGIKKLTEKKRSRYATETEIRTLFQALRNTGPESLRASVFLSTVLFTGARPQSLEKLKWKDYSGGVISFSGKSSAVSGEQETLVIPDQIVGMWKTLPKRLDGLIFGKVPYRWLWDRIRVVAACPDLTARDLRRTYATIGMSNGIDMALISELLNHKSAQTTKRYAKLDQSARIEASSIIAAKINSILKDVV